MGIYERNVKKYPVFFKKTEILEEKILLLDIYKKISIFVPNLCQNMGIF